MLNKITNTILYLAIMLILMPVGIVNAQENENGLTVIVNQSTIKPVIEEKTNVVVLKNVIEKSQAKVAVVKRTSSVKAYDNSQDWSQSSWTKEQIQIMICQVFGPECQNALLIAKNESGFRPWAISKTNDYGVFQINCRWQKRRVGGNCNKFLDPMTNIKIAKQMFDEQGWNPWTTKKYLPAYQ